MEKYQLSDGDILNKLALIEKHLKMFKHTFYEPDSTTDVTDFISIQKEATRMFKHVGLNHHLAIIRYAKTDKNEGGNVELDNSDNVLIEINRWYQIDKKKVFAVMAHEICHKVLYVNGLYYSDNKIENELLTDLATVYVGFGKLSLNGCYEKEERQTTEYKNGDCHVTTKTYIHTIGYLSLRQFAVAYNYVCACYGITDSDKRSDLGEYALDMVDSIQIPVTDYKIGELKELLKKVQQADSDIVNSLVIIDALLSQIRNKLKLRHKQIREDLFLPFDYSGSDNRLDNQLTALDVISKYNNYKTDDETKDTINKLLKVVDELKGVKVCDFPNAVNELLSIECPSCGYKKKGALKEYKALLVRCPNCKDLFMWNGNDVMSHGGGIINKVKGLFK